MMSSGNEAKTEEESEQLVDANLREIPENHDDQVKRQKNFSEVYEAWLETRKGTLEKLATLQKKLHDDQLKFNKMQTNFRKTGHLSRRVRFGTKSRPIGFLASFAAVLSDSSSSIASVAQAVNIETNLAQFQEVVDHDAEVTKQMYKDRSQCFAEYSDIEEVFRKFQSNTINYTVAKVSDALEVKKYWSGLEQAFGKDDWNKVAKILESFVEKTSESSVVQDVNNLLSEYLSSNPAASDALKSFGRAMFGAFEGLGFTITGNQSSHMNEILITQDEVEISQLESTVERESVQSKLEVKVLDAIDSLIYEMDEVNKAYFQLVDSNCD